MAFNRLTIAPFAAVQLLKQLQYCQIVHIVFAVVPSLFAYIYIKQ